LEYQIKLKKLIRRIRADFHKLNNLTLKIRDNDYDTSDDEYHTAHFMIESYRKSLEKLRREGEKSIYWSTECEENGVFIIIWV
jgi:hypothetical protein